MNGNVQPQSTFLTAAQNLDAPATLVNVEDENRPLLADENRTTYWANNESSNESQTHGYDLKRGPSSSALDTAVIITIVSFITGVSSLLAGLVVIAIPSIVEDLDLPPHLKLW